MRVTIRTITVFVTWQICWIWSARQRTMIWRASCRSLSVNIRRTLLHWPSKSPHTWYVAYYCRFRLFSVFLSNWGVFAFSIGWCRCMEPICHLHKRCTYYRYAAFCPLDLSVDLLTNTIFCLVLHQFNFCFSFIQCLLSWGTNEPQFSRNLADLVGDDDDDYIFYVFCWSSWVWLPFLLLTYLICWHC